MVEDLARALHMAPAVFSPILVFGLIVALAVVGLILNRVFHSTAKRHPGTWGELFFSLMESLPLPLLLLLALYTGLESLSLPAAYERIGSKVIFVLVVIVVFYFPAKALIVFLNRAGQTNPALLAVTQPATMGTRVLFAMLALFIILEKLGISLTGVWTTLGVGSVAVALALQETLGSFFAGLCLLFIGHCISNVLSRG